MTNVELLQSTGDDSIDAAYLKDLYGWHFTPATVDGRPVAAKKRLVFKLAFNSIACPNGGKMQVPAAEDAHAEGHP